MKGEGAKKLIKLFTDPVMTNEAQALVLGYAKGRLDAQKDSVRKNIADGEIQGGEYGKDDKGNA